MAAPSSWPYVTEVPPLLGFGLTCPASGDSPHRRHTAVSEAEDVGSGQNAAITTCELKTTSGSAPRPRVPAPRAGRTVGSPARGACRQRLFAQPTHVECAVGAATRDACLRLRHNAALERVQRSRTRSWGVEPREAAAAFAHGGLPGPEPARLPSFSFPWCTVFVAESRSNRNELRCFGSHPDMPNHVEPEGTKSDVAGGQRG